MPRSIIFLIFLFPLVGLRAQEKGPFPGFGIESNIFAGRIVKHSHKFTAPVPTLSTSLDMHFSWQTYGKREWQQRCNYPKIGVGITYTNYGNEKVFGQCVGIYPSIQVPIWHTDKLEWTFRAGNGLGYVTQKYRKGIDTINTAIGSHLNDFAIFMTDLRYHFDEHWHVQIGGNFTHISNSDYRKPNLGVNMAGVHVGVQYYPGTCNPKHIVRDLPRVRDRWVVNVRGAVSYKEARAAGNPILPTYIGALSVGKRFHGRIKGYIGADYAFHNDVLAFMKNYGIYTGRERAWSWDGTVFAGCEYMVGNLGLIAQVGVYYHQTFLKFVPIVEKIGGHYYVYRRQKGPVKEVFISAMLTTHGIQAEYSEYGVGFGF